MGRLFWIGVGVGLAVAGRRWLRQQAQRFSASNVGGRLTEAAQDLGKLARVSIAEGRRAMAEKEAEMRASLAEEPTLGP